MVEEEIVRTGFLGYTSQADVFQDGARLMLAITAFMKFHTGEPISTVQLANLISRIRKHWEGLR